MLAAPRDHLANHPFRLISDVPTANRDFLIRTVCHDQPPVGRGALPDNDVLANAGALPVPVRRVEASSQTRLEIGTAGQTRISRRSRNVASSKTSRSPSRP